MSVVFANPARTSFFLVALVIIDYGRETKANDEFECPVKCSTDVYRPICLRGKSYANLCVLKRDICSGKIARELYSDVEACPGYEKDDDANGASVEAIDKNGVIFRNLIDRPAKMESSAPATDLHVADSTDFVKNERGSRRRVVGRQCERLEWMRICRQTCSTRDTYLRPVRVLGASSPCGVRFLICRCRIPCRCSESGSSGALWLENYRLSQKTSLPKYPRGRTLVAPRFVRKKCRINCNPNEYRPILIGRHVLRNDCYPKRAVCEGSIRRP